MSQPYIGEIRIFAGNFAPVGWMFCAGQILPISQYTTLFNLIGTTYGGDGQTTFALPNLQSRVPVHMGAGFVLAQAGGAETVTLTVSQIPAHNHPALANGSGANSESPQGSTWGSWGSLGTPFSSQAASAPMSAQAVQSSGGSQPHDNMLPYVTMNFIISLFGVFPSQT